MPTYEYGCKSCGHTFEAFQNMKDEPLKVCPECGKEIRRLINGGSGIIFKGAGFYVTDKSAGKSAPKPAGEHADAAKPDTAKETTPAKPETGTEPKPQQAEQKPSLVNAANAVNAAKPLEKKDAE